MQALLDCSLGRGNQAKILCCNLDNLFQLESHIGDFSELCPSNLQNGLDQCVSKVKEKSFFGLSSRVEDYRRCGTYGKHSKSNPLPAQIFP